MHFSSEEAAYPKHLGYSSIRHGVRKVWQQQGSQLRRYNPCVHTRHSLLSPILFIHIKEGAVVHAPQCSAHSHSAVYGVSPYCHAQSSKQGPPNHQPPSGLVRGPFLDPAAHHEKHSFGKSSIGSRMMPRDIVSRIRPGLRCLHRVQNA